MATAPDITVQGTGIVGMTLALSLAQARLRVALVGSVEPPSNRDVRAYAINHAGRATLQAVGAWPDDERVSTPVRQMRVFGDAQGCVQFDAPAQDSLTWIVDVPALIHQLQEAVKSNAQIDVRGDAPQAALTVICEGRDTQSRALAGLGVRSMAYPHHALATRVRAEQGHAGTAWQWFDGERILGLLPLDGPEGKELAVVWSQAGAKAAAWRSQTPEALGEALSEASHHVLGHLHVNAPVATWPLVLSRAVRWVAPGVALAGDAAHTVHPLAGQGLNLGLADVAQLTRVLSEREYWRGLGDYKLLRRYERARALPTRLMQAGTDALFLSFASDWPAMAMLRNTGMQWFDRWDTIKNAAMAQARAAN
jgi:2-polyprenyl-6-methoxyphenol hydroxylase-like FAD-dependent oxidoreductase